MTIDQTGALSGVRRKDFLPFGEELTQGGRTSAQGYAEDSSRFKFRTYERDEETKLDYAQARYYSNSQGRFISVDPENADAELEFPQSWNGYAYTRNNPLNFTDASGTQIDICSPNGKNCHPHKNKDLANLRKYCEASGECEIVDDRVTGGRILVNGEVIATFANEFDGTPAGQFVSDMHRLSNTMHGPLVTTTSVMMAPAAAIRFPAAIPLLKRGFDYLTKSRKTPEDILKNTRPGRKTGGRSRQRESSGGMNQANKDFDSMNPSNVEIIQTPWGPGRVGKLRDGRTVKVRPGSSDGRPTLEIRRPSGRGDEIRYDP